MYDHLRIWFCAESDSVAQLAEQWTFNPLVLGSSPSGVTLKMSASGPMREPASMLLCGNFDA